MNTSPLHLAALAVAAVDGLEAVGTRPPYHRTSDFQYGGVLDARGRHWVIKVPLHSLAATVLEAEVAVAPQLIEALRQGQLPFDVIRPAGFVQADAGRAMAYLAPMGKPRDFETLQEADARELGRTLATIHALDADVVIDSGLPAYTSVSYRDRIATELHEIDSAGKIPGVLRRRWDNALEDAALWEFTPRVVHGDVAADNFLWSDGTVTSVLGFGQAHVGDPAQDFAALVSGVPEELFDSIFEAYTNARSEPIDEHFFNRAVLLSELALPRWMMFGLRRHDAAIVADAENMMAELAAEVDADPELSVGPTWTMDPTVGEQLNSSDVSITDTDDGRFT